jgi:hypothetical protein
LIGLNKRIKFQQFKPMSVEFKPLAKPTSFDGVLLKDIKLTELPSFLWQHAGRNGQLRFKNFFFNF